MDLLSDLSPLSSITLPFSAELFPDARLFERAQLCAQMLAAWGPTGTRPERAARRAFQRWIQNPRLDATRLLEASADPTPLLDLDDDAVVLLSEDTSLVRAPGVTRRPPMPVRCVPRRIGAYLLHAAIAADPTTGWPIAWLGADVWTRPATLRHQ